MHSIFWNQKHEADVEDLFILAQNQMKNTIKDPILSTTNIIHTVVTSAAEAECVSLYMNAKTAIPIQHTLMELGHK